MGAEHNSLEIHVRGDRDFAAESITLCHKLLGDEPRRLTRGRSPLSRHGSPLPWSAAVRALVALSIRHVISAPGAPNSTASPFEGALIGERGSLCRSLDYALAKKPAWLIDLFGNDACGMSLVGRFFWRQNPEGKRSGPTKVAFNHHMIAAQEVSIFVNGLYVTDPEKLRSVLSSVEESGPESMPSRTVIKSLPVKESEPGKTLGHESLELRPLLSSLITRELSRTLTSTSVFSRDSLEQSVRQIANSELFQMVAGGHAKSLACVLESSSHMSRVGVSPSLSALHKMFTPERPLRVSVSVVTVGSIALFQYLSSHRGLPVEINYRFSTGIEVARSVTNGSTDPDLCVGAAPSSIAILSHARKPMYQPIMLMPKHTHRLLASRNGSDSISHGNYRLLTEEPSGALSYFRALVERDLIQQKKISLHHSDPDETLSLLEQGDPSLRSILWFPAYDLAEIFCGAKVLDTHTQDLGDSWILLLAHQRLRTRRVVLTALLAELHGAWLELRESRSVMNEVVEGILSDPTYVKVLTRCHGFHKLRAHSESSLKIAM